MEGAARIPPPTHLTPQPPHPQGDSHEAAVSRGRHEIVSLVEALRISPSGEAVEAAHRLYRLALQRNFTRGRRVNQVRRGGGGGGGGGGVGYIHDQL